MPVLPFMDALILLGWSSLLAGFLLKAIYLTTAYRPTFFGLVPSDFLLVAVVSLLFALTLAARTWVKAAEPELLARRRRARALERLAYAEPAPAAQGEEVDLERAHQPAAPAPMGRSSRSRQSVAGL
jgi:hypothetical protein